MSKNLDDLPTNQIDYVSASHNGSQILPSITKDYLSELDFPDHDYELLVFLNFFTNTVSLPGEALGHTSVIQ